jgi:hypothetical protein
MISDEEMTSLRSVNNDGSTELWFTPGDARPRVWFRLEPHELRDAITRLETYEGDPVYAEMLDKLRHLLALYEAPTPSKKAAT